MAEMVEVEKIERLVVHPGETLVFTVPPSTSMEQAELLRARAPKYLPDGVRVMIVTSDVSLRVVSAKEG